MSEYRVKDLIAKLQTLDPELPVLLQSDPEGNGFFWASGVDDEAWVTPDSVDNDRTYAVYGEDDIKNDEGAVDPDYVKVAIIFP